MIPIIAKVIILYRDGSIVRIASVDDKDFSPFGRLASSIPHHSSVIPSVIMQKYRYKESCKVIADWKFFGESVTFGECIVGPVPICLSSYNMTRVSYTNFQEQLVQRERILMCRLLQTVQLDYKEVFAYKSYYLHLQWLSSHLCVRQVLFKSISLLMRLGL